MAKSIRVVLTGGHAATTALSVIEEIVRRGNRRQANKWDLYWIGTKRAFEGSRAHSLEYEIIPSKGVTFHSIISGRFQKKFTFWTIPSLLKIPVGFIHAAFLLIKIRPKVVVSFGGFAAYPVVVISWIFGIPVVLHEQTAAVGRANRYSAFFARKICIARESSRKYFPKGKTVHTGNALMSQIWEVPPRKVVSKPPVIFVFGGSRGSVFLNDLVLGKLTHLLSKYYVVHQVGHQDFARVRRHRGELPAKLCERYEIYKTIDPMQVDGVYKRADVVVARGGANTVDEIMATKRPSVLVPIPWSAYDEQTKNAQFAVEFGVAVILPQESASPDSLKNRSDDL